MREDGIAGHVGQWTVDLGEIVCRFERRRHGERFFCHVLSMGLRSLKISSTHFCLSEEASVLHSRLVDAVLLLVAFDCVQISRRNLFYRGRAARHVNAKAFALRRHENSLAVRMAGLPLSIAGHALITAEGPPKPAAHPTALPKDIASWHYCFSHAKLSST